MSMERTMNDDRADIQMFNEESLNSLEANTINSYTSPDNKQKPEYTSMFATVMNLVNSLLGAGILSVPNAFTHCGFVPSLVLMTVVASLSYVASILVTKLQNVTNAGSFSDLAKITMGRPGSFVLSCCVVLFCYSSMTAYLIIGSDVIMFFLDMAGVHIDKSSWQRTLLVMVFSLCLPIAMTIPKQIAVLSAVSTFAFIGLNMFVIAMILEGCVHLPRDGIAPSVETGTLNMHFFNSLAIFSLCFALAVILLPVIMPSNPNLHARYKAISWASYLSYFIVAIPAILGYLMFGDETKEVIFDSFDKSDIVMIVVRLSYFVILTASYPVLGISVLTTYGVAIYGVQDQKDLTWKQRAVCLFLENILTLSLAMFFPNVRPIMAIGGAIGGCMTNFFFPPSFYLIVSNKPWYTWTHILLIILAIFGILTTVISTYEAVLDAIHAFTKK
ncbi:Transmembrane amino acid transporter protein [Tritrichomonas foetus]|uniref:Transmembrane amino acid transporter protein n=1 Tax=Tritrichomonas foetus TaxID=1144522 RepID=A0A1J4JVR1_9EUKA|nr:Transmembrane amino acid transporter protein [Tritrichomonas foetus]|eukprot:OHT02520.1 Transmembrane amino acid transporter protein [Tritrichomonas foetus]